MSVGRSIAPRSLAAAASFARGAALVGSLAMGAAQAQVASTTTPTTTPTAAATNAAATTATTAAATTAAATTAATPTPSSQTIVATTGPTAPASPFASMLQGLFGLIVVVALIYGVAWFLKRVGPRTRAGGIVQVLGGASVGPREKVVVVRFGGETLLLGVAPGQVSLLHTAVDSGEVADGSTTNASPRFIDRLRAARSGA